MLISWEWTKDVNSNSVVYCSEMLEAHLVVTNTLNSLKLGGLRFD